jgi:Tfp pilus assembly protein PilN
MKVDLFSDFRFPHKRAISRWVIITAVAFSITFIIVLLIHIKAHKKRVELINKLEISETNIRQFQENIKDLTGEQRINRDLKRKKGALDANKQEYGSVLALLYNLSRVIPSKTWVKRLVYKENLFMIEGHAPTYKELMTFYTSLSRLDGVSACCIEHERHDKLLKFMITAKISSIFAKYQ